MRPAGYVGQLFTYPLPLALALWAVRPGWWPVAVAALAVRLASAWATAVLVVRDDRFIPRHLWLLPVQDVLGFSLWIAGFFGSTVTWRGRALRAEPGRHVQPAGGVIHPRVGESRAGGSSKVSELANEYLVVWSGSCYNQVNHKSSSTY